MDHGSACGHSFVASAPEEGGGPGVFVRRVDRCAFERQSLAVGTRFPFSSYPRGWYVVALSEELVPGEVKTLRYFGRELVAFRTESGVLSITDPTCPHLGAHLGGGCVEGEKLRCPFHGWAFGPDGGCREVPYAPKIPPKARLRSWHVREVNGVVHAWFCPNAGEPQWEPQVFEDEGWTRNRSVRWEVRTHPQEIAENTVDCAHLGPVHDVSTVEVRELEQEGPYMRVLLHMVARGTALGMPDEVNDVDLDVELHGLGQLVAVANVTTAGFVSRQRIHPTPIDDEHVAIYGVVNTRFMPDPEYTEEIAELFYEAFVEDFARDFPIWENKAYLEKPMLAGGDGPIGRYRKWCRQFYDEVAETETKVEVEPQPTGLLNRLVSVLRGPSEKPREPERAKRPSLKLVAEDGKALAVARMEPVDRGTPASASRFESVEDYFASLTDRFDAQVGASLDAVFQWELTGEGARKCWAEVRGGEIQCGEGVHEKPTLTITMSADDYLLMINGDLNGAKAFSTGRGRLRGPVRLAMKMQKLFPLDKAV